MRRIAALTLLVGLAACNGAGTDPQSGAISIRVRDDAGGNAGRNLVVVRMASSANMNLVTRDDGTADVSLTTPGTYEVSVVPRIGFAPGVGSASKTVTVSPGSHASVDFTVYRAGADGSLPVAMDW